MPDETTSPRIYKVPEQNHAILLDRIKRLQRRALKLGSTAITVTNVGHEDHPAYRVGSMEGAKTVYLAPGQDPITKWGVNGFMYLGFSRRYFLLTVDGTAPKLNDWAFVGAIDIVRDDEFKVVGNMVRTIPGLEMPVEYRTSDPHCDHCGVDRRWKNTFVVKHPDGTHKQVGRQCLRDFTGHNSPEAVASMAEVLISYGELLDSAEDEGWELGGGRGIHRYNLEAILTTVATIVRLDGWKPKAFMERSTAATLSWFVNARGNEAAKAKIRYEASEFDRQTAKETLDWLISLNEKDRKSDYESNLAVIALAGIVEDKMFGFVASAVPSYLRTRDRLEAIKHEKVISQYVGEEKKRMEAVLTLVTFKYIENDFGTKTMMKFRDEAGNVIMWWATSDVAMACGTKIKAKFTIKKHDEYEGVKQTTVLRLAVLETIQNELVAATA